MRVAGMCQCEQWLSSAPTAQITLQREQADGEHGRGRRGSAGSEQGSGRAKIVSDRRPNTAETDLGVFSFSLAPSERDPAAVPSIQDSNFSCKKKNPTKAGISWAPSVVEESSCHRVIAVERSLRLSITYPVVCRLAAASACWCQQQDNCRRAVATASVLQRQSPSHDPELTRQS